jgi:hypothetical protein
LKAELGIGLGHLCSVLLMEDGHAASIMMRTDVIGFVSP